MGSIAKSPSIENDMVEIELQESAEVEDKNISTDNNESQDAPLTSPRDIAIDAVKSIFPKVVSVPPLVFFVLVLALSIPSALYIVGFTKIGFGVTTYFYLSEHAEQYAYIVGLATTFLFLVLYLLDIGYWESDWGKRFRTLGYIIIVLGLFAVIMFMSGEHPYGPIALFTVVIPVWILLVKKLPMFRDVEQKKFISWLSAPLFFTAFAILILWISWAASSNRNRWNTIARLEDAEESGCEPDYSKMPECRSSVQSSADLNDHCFIIDVALGKIVYPEGCPVICTEVFEDCINTFILWVGPFLVSMSLLFLSFFSTFLRPDGNIEKDFAAFVKVWFVLIASIWVAASLAGAGAGLFTTLAALTLAGFIASTLFFMSSYRSDERVAQVKTFISNLTEKYSSYVNIARGLIVVTCAPVAIIYVLLSILKQGVRRSKLFPCSREPDNEYSFVTDEVSELISSFKSWHRVKVYTYAIYWGIFFMSMFVIVAKFTLLLLSWLVEETSDLNLGVVTAIMIGVGLVMFLLPPVPGVPIYLTLGIVVVAIGRDTMGIVWSIVYSIAVSLALKLFACTLQQKMIGGLLKGYVSVRQLVQINTKLIRAMKLVLGERGIGIAKVSILVGGPDWPTSVLCGIMDLSLFPVLVGTIPVVFLIAPTVITGSFTYMASLKLDDGRPEFPWASTAAAIFFGFTSVVQFGAMISAAYYMERVLTNRADEVDALEIDKEVQEAEDKAKARKKAYEAATKWDDLPLWSRITLTLSVLLMSGSCYTLQIFGQQSFYPDYELTSKVSVELEGKFLNFILPLGRIAIFVLFGSILLFIVFTMWAKRMVSQSMELAIIPEDTDVSNTINDDDKNDR